MQAHQFKLFKTGDIFFWVMLLIGSYVLYASLLNSSGKNSLAIVEISGEVKYRIDLEQEGEYVLEEFNPPVKIVVRDHKIAVMENDCPQKICVRVGYISNPGQMIACVPKKLLIYIPAQYEKKGSVNAVTG
jgi:hypothetical protein